MRILHVSDTHSAIKKLEGNFDYVTFSGDFFPDFFCNRDKVASCQLDWLEEKVYDIKNWLKGHPFLFILGNHDWVNPDLMEEVSHVILAHHGRLEWGSPIEPQTPEALIVHQADMLSAYFTNTKKPHLFGKR